MPQAVRCPHCARAMELSESAAGKKIKCGKCATVSSISLSREGRLELQMDRAPDAAAPALAPGSRCASCGEPADAHAEFCTRCGESLGGGARPLPGVPAPRRRAGRYQGIASRQRAKTVAGGATWILVLAILFLIGGTVFGFMAKSDADEARHVLADLDDAQEFPVPIDGEAMTVGELRKRIDLEVTMAFAINYGLAAVMLLIYFWARRSPLPAITTALCVYLVVLVASAIADPTTLFQGILIKILAILGLIAGIKAALQQQAAQRRAPRRPPAVGAGR